MEGPLAYEIDRYYQPNLRDSSPHHSDSAHLRSVGLHATPYSQCAGYPLPTGAQYFPTAPIHDSFATHAVDRGFPPAEHTGTTSGNPSAAPDSPRPAFPPPIHILHDARKDFRPPCIPVLVYRPMEPSGSYISRFFDPLSVEAAAASADTHPESGGPSRAFSEADIRNSFEDIWAQFARSSAGQAVSCMQSGGIGASAAIHPTTRVPGSVKPNMDWIGERRGEVVLSTGEMNGVESNIMSGINDWPNQCFEEAPCLARNDTPASLPGPFPDPESSRAVSTIRTVRPNHRANRRYDESVYDRPGKKPAAEYEPDSYRLRKLCRQRGGKDFAVAWISKIFEDRVAVGALLRPLTMLEVDAMSLRLPGFKPAQGYDGFLERFNNRFECGLCPDEKRMHWKNKKDAVPHLRKFHFGLADRCIDCHKLVYSVGEMNSHSCKKRKNSAECVRTVEASHSDPHLA